MKKAIVFGCVSGLLFMATTLDVQAQSKIHVVEQGQTLYSISKSHDINVDDLLKANPSIEDNIISIGQELNIPSKNAPVIQPLPSTARPVSTEVPTSTIRNNQFAMIEHVVQEKETLYAISKQYGVSIDEIMAWNHLEDNNIRIGSTILIRKQLAKEPVAEVAQKIEDKVERKVEEKTVPVEKAQEVAQEAVTQSAEIEKVVTESVKPAPSVTPPSSSGGGQSGLSADFTQAQQSGKTLYSSRETISWINTENAQMSNSFFALHKTAPVGTVIKVTNLVNKRIVYVKVLGRLPETSENIDLVLRMSSAGKKALMLNGDKAYVNIDYYK